MRDIGRRDIQEAEGHRRETERDTQRGRDREIHKRRWRERDRGERT
jgi:hypothetical protein